MSIDVSMKNENQELEMFIQDENVEIEISGEVIFHRWRNWKVVGVFATNTAHTRTIYSSGTHHKKKIISLCFY